MTHTLLSRFRDVPQERAAEFVAKGYARRHFFPHRIYYLPKGGPDGFKLARRMVGRCRPDQLREVVLYATAPVLDEFPRALFFDDDLIWHRQHFGRAGQVATANLVEKGRELYSMVHVSDLVQRIGRRREHKTRIENRFEGWAHLLVNAILNFACERGARRMYLPTAELAMLHTDPARRVQAELFERVYDRTVRTRLRVECRQRWWVADVAANRDRLVTPARGHEVFPAEKIICLAHDVERGAGHRTVAPDFAAFADASAPQHLEEMLAVEADLQLAATYNVLGCLLGEVKDQVHAHGHAIGFHSFDHSLARTGGWWQRLRPALNGTLDQLARCRAIDYRIRGYRPAQSRLTTELTPANLCRHNFEWLASSAASLGQRLPALRHGIVRVPILFDDFFLYTGALPFPAWEREALQHIHTSDFVAFSLHDCYAHLWLPHFRAFLEKVTRLGRLQTIDEVADRVILTQAL